MPVINGVVTVLPAPDGYVVDFDHPQRQAVSEAYYVAAFGTFFAVLFMGQRLYTKLFLSGGLQLDDVFLLLAWGTSIATIAMCLHMFASGAGGAHAWEISITKFNIYMLDVFLAAPIYTLSGSFAKISLLIFYLRLSPQRWFRWSIWGVIAFIFGYTVGIFFGLIFSCSPISVSWDITVTGECINRPALYIATAVSNIISDIILFVLPMPMVVKLQLPLKQKLGLFFIFGVGSLTVVTSIIRVSLLPQLLTSFDASWVIAYASLWIIVESNLMIICGALPTLRKFFKHVAPRIIGESAYAAGSKNTPTNKDTGSASLAIRSNPGPRGARNAYSEFDREGSETYIMTSIETSKGKDVLNTSDSVGERSWADNESLSGSEKGTTKGLNGGVVRTNTITVEWSDRLSDRPRVL